MFRRISFPLIALFWVLMNLLLWRSEFAGRDEPGSVVPSELIIEKVLSAPDDSPLEITHHGRKVGYCRWQASVGESVQARSPTEEEQLEGMIKRPSEYVVDWDGNVLLEQMGGRFRFELHGNFATNLVWKRLAARVSQRPVSWEMRADARDQQIHFLLDDGDEKVERHFQFADLRHPEKVLRDFGIPPGLIPQIGLLSLSNTGTNLALGLRWEARHDWLKVGHARVRVYRLQARLLDRYQASVIVSRVGEILRVDLPDEWVLTNDALSSL